MLHTYIQHDNTIQYMKFSYFPFLSFTVLYTHQHAARRLILCDVVAWLSVKYYITLHIFLLTRLVFDFQILPHRPPQCWMVSFGALRGDLPSR
jgi:hypothetical protein